MLFRKSSKKTFVPDLKSALPAALGPDAHVVGGAVRDRLLGRPVIDVDIAVHADAGKAAAKIAATLKGRSFPLHADLDIFRVVADGFHVDVARFQGKDLAADLDRRDLTINALAVPVSEWFRPAWKKKIVDRHGGLSDLAKGRLVPVSPKIFREDPLRLLRVFRIAAELGLAVPAATLKLVTTHRRLILKPAAERAREELLKMFGTPNAHKALVAMDKSGLLDVLFPPAVPLRRTAPDYYGKGGVLKHTLDSVKCFEGIVETLSGWFPGTHKKIRAYLDDVITGHPRVAHCKWALLLHDIGKPKTARMIDGRLRFFEHEHVGADMVAKLSPRYRWSSEETTRYARLVRNHMRPGNLATHPKVTDKAIYRFFRDLEDDGIAMLLVSLADHLTYLTGAQKKKRNSAHELVTLRMVARFYSQTKKVIPERVITGHDIMKAFDLKPSPLIGELLTAVTEAQVEGKVKSAKDAIAFLRPLAKERP